MIFCHRAVRALMRLPLPDVEGVDADFVGMT